jgi:hypothetical protein
MKAERKRERKRERSGNYGKGPSKNPQEFSGWFCVQNFFGRKKKTKKEKSDLFSPSLSFDKKREKEISDIHTEKFHPPNNANESLSGECR